MCGPKWLQALEVRKVLLTCAAQNESADSAPVSVEKTDGASQNESAPVPVEQTDGVSQNESAPVPVEQTDGASQNESALLRVEQTEAASQNESALLPVEQTEDDKTKYANRWNFSEVILNDNGLVYLSSQHTDYIEIEPDEGSKEEENKPKP